MNVRSVVKSADALSQIFGYYTVRPCHNKPLGVRPFENEEGCRSLNGTHPPEVCLSLRLDRFSLFYINNKDDVTVGHFRPVFLNTMHHINICGLILRSADKTRLHPLRQYTTELQHHRRTPDVEIVFSKTFPRN